jgi:hypothetical protein
MMLSRCYPAVGLEPWRCRPDGSNSRSTLVPTHGRLALAPDGLHVDRVVFVRRRTRAPAALSGGAGVVLTLALL